MTEASRNLADVRLRAVAARQLGLVTRRQAAALGLTPNAVAHRLERGEWIRVSSRVLRVASAPDHPLPNAQAALLHVGRDAALGGQSAVAVWDVPGFRLDPIDLLRGRRGTTAGNELCRVRTSTAFDDGHVTDIDGLRVTTLMRELAAERPVGFRPPESRLEDRVNEVLVRAG